MNTKINKRIKKLIKKNRSPALLFVAALSIAGLVTLVKSLSYYSAQHKEKMRSVLKELVNNNSASSKKETSTEQIGSTDNMTEFPELAKTLDEYNALQMKLLKTSDENEKLKSLYNERAIVDAKNFLMLTENDFGPHISQNHLNTINFLKDSYNYQPTLSSQAALALITDPEVENQELPVKARTLLAKDRAEILYHFSAIEPTFHAYVQDAGLGPVMQKIYANVLNMQKINLAESRKQIANAKK